MPERIIVWGAGGHGKVVAEVARAAGHRVVAYADRRGGAGVLLEGGSTPCVSEDDLFDALRRSSLPYSATAVAVGVGANAARSGHLAALAACIPLPALVHPSAVVSRSASIADGVVVMPLAVVNAGVVIAAGAIVNSGAIIEHDCVIGHAAHISPGAVLSGEVRIGDLAWIGAGAALIERVRVGRAAVVGAGTVVIRDVADGTTVVGNPARVIRSFHGSDHEP